MSNNIVKSVDGVDTLKLGDGCTIMAAVKIPQQNIAGVCFVAGRGEIGQLYPELEGKTDGESKAFLRILSSDSRSLSVLIEKLQEAKAILEAAERGSE